MLAFNVVARMARHWGQVVGRFFETSESHQQQLAPSHLRMDFEKPQSHTPPGDFEGKSRMVCHACIAQQGKHANGLHCFICAFFLLRNVGLAPWERRRPHRLMQPEATISWNEKNQHWTGGSGLELNGIREKAVEDVSDSERAGSCLPGLDDTYIFQVTCLLKYDIEPAASALPLMSAVVCFSPENEQNNAIRPRLS